MTSVVLITVVSVFVVYKQKTSQIPQPERQGLATIEELTKVRPLPPVGEITLQKQLQEILANGKEADCSSLADHRYQFACHDLFKTMKK